MKFKEVLAKIAPALGATFGGPLGGAAGAVLSRVLLGKDTIAKPEELEAALGVASPETLLALKQADAKFATDMKALEIDVFRLEVADRASSREMFKVNIWPQSIAAALYTVGFFVFLIWLLVTNRADLPEWQSQALTLLLGGLLAGQTAVLSWLFGSTYGSQSKTAALAASAPPNGK